MKFILVIFFYAVYPSPVKETFTAIPTREFKSESECLAKGEFNKHSGNRIGVRMEYICVER
jgi:hypothetical protein